MALAQSGGFTVNVGDILVANYEGFNVAKINPTDRSQVHLGTFILPTDLVLAPDGGLYVAELEGAVWRLDLATGLITPVIETGAGPASVFGIALGPQGELYVTSGADDAVYRVDPVTGTVTVLTAGVHLAGIVGIDLLDAERVVVSCSSAEISRLVSVALADGAQTILASGGDLDQPWGVFVLGEDVFTTTYDSRRILRLSNGEIAVIAQTPGFPHGIAVDLEGNIVVGSKGTADEVRVYAPDGTWLDAFSGGFISVAAGIEIATIRIDPTSPPTVILQSASDLATGFSDVQATVDETQRIVTAPRHPGDRFYRLRAEAATRITDIRLTTNQVILQWE